jgi:NADH-quinone oxidoreductase subunit N
MYLFMNLGVFSVIAFVRNRTGSESIETYQGLMLRAPWLTVAMTIFLVSLAGVPPMAGFVAKFQVFKVLYDNGWFTLLVIGGVNSVISVVYYFNILRVMILAGEPRTSLPIETPLSLTYSILVAVPVLVFGILWQAPENWSSKAAGALEPTEVIAELQRPEAEVSAVLPAVEKSEAN